MDNYRIISRLSKKYGENLRIQEIDIDVIPTPCDLCKGEESLIPGMIITCKGFVIATAAGIPHLRCALGRNDKSIKSKLTDY